MTRTVRDYQHDEARDWYDSLSDADRADYDAAFRKTAAWQWGEFADALIALRRALAEAFGYYRVRGWIAKRRRDRRR